MKKILIGFLIGIAIVPSLSIAASTIDAKLVSKLKGRILLQTQQHGEAWYLNPTDGKKYYMKDGATAYDMMRKFGMGITDADLEKIPQGNLSGVVSAPSTSAEYKSALNKATSYSNIMHMSKLGVYDQLVSEYGEKFSANAAQYAIDNVKADWNANALAKAKSYQDTMNMSPAGIHDQLTSANGEKFTQSEADYAIQHLND